MGLASVVAAASSWYYCSQQRQQQQKVRSMRNWKTGAAVKLPQIKDKSGIGSLNMPNKAIKLERIAAKKGMMLLDIGSLNKIEKQFAVMTKRNEKKQQESSLKKDEMRESRLLLLKDKAPAKNKKNNENLLSNLVMYHPPSQGKKTKIVNIPQSNISTSPSKRKKVVRSEKTEVSPCPYNQSKIRELEKLDFVKLFIIQELLCYIYKTAERNKDEMSGFCKFYNENSTEDAITLISGILARQSDYLEAVFYQKLGFYIFLILGTDIELKEEGSFLLKSLMEYLHTNNLIILDVLMEIVDIEKLPLSSQFHVYNTSRFNEDRRRINKNDKMGLLARNNQSSVDIIKSILVNCGFDSLKTFVSEILANQEIEMGDKIKQVCMMLVSLDSILTNSLNQQQNNKIKPPFLGEKQKDTPYTLVLDMDETLIHYYEDDRVGKLLVRPHCHEFLEQMSRYYQIVIFTAAVKEYADSILDSIDQDGYISHRLYREHTRLEDYVSIKDLSCINRDLSKTIIIDNIASNFKMQPRNGIAISTWTGDPDDMSLLNLSPVLVKLAESGVGDVRDGLEYISEYMESRMKANQEIEFENLNLKGL